MEDVKKRYVWTAQEDFKRTSEALRLAIKVNAMREQELRDREAQFETQFRHQFQIPSQMPPECTEFFYIEGNELRSASIKNPTFGYAVTFNANECGPEVVQEDGTVIRNMLTNSTSPLTEKAPLYPAGATLCYFGRGAMPSLRPDDVFSLDNTKFNPSNTVSCLDNTLSVVKTPGFTIANEDRYQETPTTYKILCSYGLPAAMRRINMQARLARITGRVVGVEPVCSAVNSSLKLFTVSLSEMLVPIEPQVKSAVRKQ